MFNDIQQKFIIKQTGSINSLQAVYRPYNNEVEWLRATISGLGGTPTGQLSDLWKQLLALNSLPVTNSINANRKTYYLNNS